MVTFQRGVVREVDFGNGPESVVSVSGLVDGVQVIELDWPEAATDSTIQEHMEWELRRRGLIPSL